MKNFFLRFSIIIIFLFSFSFAQATDFQASVMNQVGAAAGEQGAGMGGVQNPQMFVVNIINIVLGAVGVVFTSLIFYGGIMFLTAQGEEEKAKKGAGIVKAAVIGLLIVLASYAVELFIGSITFESNVTEDYYI